MTSYLVILSALVAGASALLLIQTAGDRERYGMGIPAAHGAVLGLACLLLFREIYRLAFG